MMFTTQPGAASNTEKDGKKMRAREDAVQLFKPDALDAAANNATRHAHDMTSWQALMQYKKGTAWALFLSLTLILAGFDVTVCVSLVAVPAFQTKYGYEYDPLNAPGEFIIPVPWQVGITMAVVVPQIFGAFLGGPLIDRYGRRAPLYFLLMGNIAFVFLEMFATSLGMLVTGALLNSICYSFYFVIAPTFAAEVVPHHLRNITTAFANMALIIGQLLGQGMISATQVMDSDLAYRIPFALQWLWAVAALIGLLKCPESPWYLIHKGRHDEAENSLRRLAIFTDPTELYNTVAMMEKTNRLEREYCETTSYLDCLKGINLRRTEIATVPFTVSIISCNLFLANSTYFLSLAGLNTNAAFYMGVGSYALAFVGNLACYPLMNYVGRRTVFVIGSLVITAMLFVIGFLDLPTDYDDRPALPWAQAIILIVTNGIYNMTTGPASFVIMSETGTTRLRSKTVSISVAVQVIASVPVMVGVPYQLNPNELFWRGKNGFFYGGLALIGAIWAYFRLPELKGRTFEEIDLLFDLKIPAKDFAATTVHVGSLEEEKHHDLDQSGR